MPPKELTRAQLSSRLSYSQHTPAFLRRLQNQYSGRGFNDNGDEDNDDGEFEDYDRGSGRPPIPRRPSIPERPPDDPGSAGEDDDDDERPQVVVLKEGKHLTEREAENVRRKAKGLPPLPEPEAKDVSENTPTSKLEEGPSESKTKPKKPPLTFSTTTKSSMAKRKLEVIGQQSDEEEEVRGRGSSSKKSKPPPPTSKKVKKTAKSKTLLSFVDDA